MSIDAIYRNYISLHLAIVSLTDIGFLFVPLDDDWLIIVDKTFVM